MGCTNSKTIKSRIETISMVECRPEGIGMLRVRVQHINLVKGVDNLYEGNSGFLQIHFMNQDFITALSYDQIIKSTIYPTQTQFCFVLNLLDTEKSIQINILAQQNKTNHLFFKIASGREIIDQKLFTQKKTNQTNKKSYSMCLTSQHNGQKVAWVRVELEFMAMKYDILTIRVDSVTLRSQSEIRQRRIYVNIKIGGQQFQSQSFLQNEHLLPTWQNAIACFIIPEYLSYGRLSVYEKDGLKGVDYLVGELKFNLKVILQSDQLQSFTETLTLKEDNVTGSVNLQCLKTRDKMPVIHRIQRPKRITYMEDNKLQLPEKNQNGCYGGNYVSKKSSKATLCSQTKSLDIVSPDRFNKKLLELKENYLSIGDDKGIEKNQFHIDQQNNKGRKVFRGNGEQMGQNVGMYSIFSDHQLNLQHFYIPQTSSILVSKHPSEQIQNPLLSKKAPMQQITPSQSINREEQYSSFDLSCCSKINKKSTNNNINNLQKINSLQKKSIQTGKSIVRFASIPDDMSSKSFGGSLDGQQHQNGNFWQRSGDEKRVCRNEQQKQNYIIADNKTYKSVIIQQTQPRLFKKPLEQRYSNNSQFQMYQKPVGEYNEFPQQNCINYADFDIKISTIIAKKTVPTSS